VKNWASRFAFKRVNLCRYAAVACPNNEYIVKAGGLGILVVSIMWGWKIIMMFVKEAKKLLGVGGGGGGGGKKKTQ
jgi:hypothetical protein